jgi:N-acetylneuraminic acid mutarotase
LHAFDLRNTFYSLVTPIGASPSPRTWHAYTKIPGPQFLIFGGGNYSGFTVESVDNELWIYNSEENEWTLQSPSGTAPSPRITASAAFDGEHTVYIFGGVDVEFNFLNDLFAYDLDTNSYTTVTQTGEQPPGVSDTRLVIKDNYLYLQGGEILEDEGIGNLEGVYRFDLLENVWVKLSPSPDITSHPERDAQVFSRHGNQIWMFGGDANGPNFFNLQNDTWHYNINENAWHQIHHHKVPPASKRDSFAWKDNELYVFIAVIGPATPAFTAAEESQQVWKLVVT